MKKKNKNWEERKRKIFNKKAKIIISIIILIVVVYGGSLLANVLLNKYRIWRDVKAQEWLANGLDAYREATMGKSGDQAISAEMQTKKYKETVEELEKVINTQPNNKDVLQKLAVSYYNLGDLGKAEEFFSQAVKVTPQDAILHNNLGNVLRSEKKYEEAKKHYREAITIDPHFSATYVNLAVLLRDFENNRAEAIKVLEEGTAQIPKDEMLKQILMTYRRG